MPRTILFSTFLGDFIEYEVQLDDGQNLIVNEYTKGYRRGAHTDGEKVHLSLTLPRRQPVRRERGGAQPVNKTSRFPLETGFWFSQGIRDPSPCACSSCARSTRYSRSVFSNKVDGITLYNFKRFFTKPLLLSDPHPLHGRVLRHRRITTIVGRATTSPAKVLHIFIIMFSYESPAVHWRVLVIIPLAAPVCW